MDSHLMIAEIDPKIVEMDELIIRCEAKLGAGKEVAGPSDPGPADGAGAEKVSPGAWAAPGEADSAAASRKQSPCLVIAGSANGPIGAPLRSA